MNPTPAPEADGPLTSQQRGHDLPKGPLAVESTTVPRQKAGPHGTLRAGSDALAGAVPADRPGDTVRDPLDHPDPLRAADSAGTENLLRCWTRENDLPRPRGDTLRVPLPASGTALLVPVTHWSATGWHRFGDAVPGERARRRPGRRRRHRGSAAQPGERAERRRGPGGEGGRLRTAHGGLHRRPAPQHPPRRRKPISSSPPSSPSSSATPCTPRPRAAKASPSRRRCSTHPSCAAPSRSTGWPWTVPCWPRSRRGRRPAGRSLRRRSSHRTPKGCDLPEGTTALPLHPWQAAEVLRRPEVVALCEKGLLHDLGPYGERWHPTSSVRTVHRPGSDLDARSCPWAYASPTPAGRTSVRSSTAEPRCTGCCAPASPTGGGRRTRASTSSGTPPGSPSTNRTAAPSPAST